MVIRGRATTGTANWVPPAWDLRSAPDGRVRFGVVMPGLLVGGVEQWLVTLLDWVDPARVVCVGVAQLEPKHLDAEMGRRVERHCPLGLGWAAVQALAERCDVLLVWSEAGWRERVAGPESCRVVLVAHGESDWTRSVMAEARHAAGLVAVSEAARRSFPEDQRERVTVIPNGVDPERVAWRVPRREMRAAWGVPEEGRLIGYLGRFSSEKGCDALIRAVAALPEGWRGAFVGCGWEEDALRESGAGVPRPGAVPRRDRGRWKRAGGVRLAAAPLGSRGLRIGAGRGGGSPGCRWWAPRWGLRGRSRTWCGKCRTGLRGSSGRRWFWRKRGTWGRCGRGWSGRGVGLGSVIPRSGLGRRGRVSFAAWGTTKTLGQLRNSMHQAEERQGGAVELDELRLPVRGGCAFHDGEGGIEDPITREDLVRRGELLGQDELIFPGLQLFKGDRGEGIRRVHWASGQTETEPRGLTTQARWPEVTDCPGAAGAGRTSPRT